MSAMNSSTGFSCFQLHLRQQPCVLPPLFCVDVSAADTDLPVDTKCAADVIQHIDSNVMEAQDNLATVKLAQMCTANCGCVDKPAYAVGDLVLLSTFHRYCAYMQQGDNCVTKFMAHYDGLYKILHVFPDLSAHTLDLPSSMQIFPTFHASLLKPYISNNDSLFPTCVYHPPPPVLTKNGIEEQEVKAILDHQCHGHSFRFLVHWKGFLSSHDLWLPGSECHDLAALDSYLILNPNLCPSFPLS